MRPNPIPAREVRATLAKHMLADGFEPILDLQRSHGPWIVDARDGREYIDFFTFYASMPLGLNHPRLNNDETIHEIGRIALNKPTNSDVYTPEMAGFVDTFARVGIPKELPYLFLIEGGALAVENMLKAAFDWKVRKNIAKGLPSTKGQQVIHFKRCFHGRSGYTLSLTDSADHNKTKYFPKFDWPRVTPPAMLFPQDEKNVEKAKVIEAKALGEIEEAIRANPDDIAALIIEPIQGEGGDNHFRPEFLRELRRLADAHEFLLLFDEVQTGVGLTGTFWAYEQLGVVPDALSFGKKMQVCGFLAGRRFDEVEDNVFKVSSRLNSTWGGNLVDMIRCRIHLEIIEDEKILEHVRREGAYLLSRLEKLSEEFGPSISNVRGRGLMCAFDLESASVREHFRSVALEEGLFILGSGPRSIRFRPPLNIDRETLDEGLRRVESALQRVVRTATA